MLGRGTFKAVFEGDTESNPELLKTLNEKPPFPIALLRNIEYQGTIVEGHSWYPLWGAIEMANINQDDSIQFLATPRSYATRDGLWWQTGLSQICWVQRVQKASAEFEILPVFSPPQSAIEAKVFLDRRLRVSENKGFGDDPIEWGVRIWQWNDSTSSEICDLINAGWASFSAWNGVSGDLATVFQQLESRYNDRKISQMADIAAWCNLGSAASEYRHGGAQYRICSAKAFT
jgi:hypothetical protein